MPQGNPLRSIQDGTAPKSLRLIAARGLIPLPPNEMLEILVCLLGDNDPEVTSEANKTLSGWSVNDLRANLQAPNCNTTVLQHFASPKFPHELIEAIILNPNTPGSSVANLALNVPAFLLELILYNRVRLLEYPDILASIKRNPSASPQIQRLVQEIESEFFAEKTSSYSVATQPASSEPQGDDWELQLEDMPDDLSLEGLPLDPAERECAILQRISNMTVPQKIKHAMLGTREVRAMLIRDTNRQVARSVLLSPKLSESEVSAFAAMRNVSEDVLREIGNSRTMTRSYNVVQNLVKNPKTPLQISQRMLSRLHTKDLTLVSRDRGVPESVRLGAQRMLAHRNTAKSQS